MSAALAGPLLAGCGEATPPRLAAWTFPPEVVIPEVPAVEPVRATDGDRQRRGHATVDGRAGHAGRDDGAGPAPARSAAAPAADSGISPGAPSDEEVRRQLEELYGEGAADVGGADGGDRLRRAVTLHRGLAGAPPDAPAAVQRIVAAANQVARLPYVYGGGHGRAEGLFVDTAYDCSGSISFALANAGLMDRPMTSGEMMRWGEPGAGEWVTIYANEGHAFMVVGGARFDTVGLRETGSRWQPRMRLVSGFVAVHPPGL